MPDTLDTSEVPAHAHQTDGKSSTAKAKHRHTVDVSGLATKAEVAELTARVDGLRDQLGTKLSEIHARLAALEKPVPPIPGPEPTPDPEPDEPPFLSRPMRVPYAINGGTDVVIENVTVNGRDLATRLGRAFTIQNVRNLRIVNVDQADWQGGIYLYNISGRLEIENVRSRNIGDGTIGSGHSNHLQLAESSVEGYIRGCRFLGGRTEDMLSIYHSGGLSADKPLIVSDNHLQGLVADTATARAWNSGSGTGIIIGDGSGSSKNGHTIVRANTLLTPGQVGIQIIDGPGLTITENVIYGEQRAQSNNPMTTWEGTPVGTAHDIRYWWLSPSGSVVDPWKHPGGSGIQFSNLVRDSSIDPAQLRVGL